MPTSFSTTALTMIGLMAIATPALANGSKFSLTMEHRLVHGKKNGVVHSLDRGVLTISGQLWVTRCAPGATGPSSVTVEVWEDGILDHSLCSFAVIPSKKLGEKVSFSTTCQSVSKSSFFVVAWKVEDDGCDIQSDGTLTTK
ncbi:hypothetical protein [Hyalangium gracile]|uniref:hypothetical protein n=1 Tax=Hyalangium gracile TaxID=394092 RepID=UPI001CCBE725|nr:hypothetical protein [Hyalangium gracile]